LSAAHQLELVGMGQHRGQRLVKQIGRGVVAGDQHQRQGVDQFGLGEGAVVLRAGVDQRSGQVLPGSSRLIATNS